MLCISIRGSTLQEIKANVERAASFAQLIELRLDLFPSLDYLFLQKLRKHVSLPMIFTLRSSQQRGEEQGHYQASEEKRLQDIEELATLNPEYFDLEADLPLSFLESFQKKFPRIQVILSCHFWEKGVIDVHRIFSHMQKIQAPYYKIAHYPKSTLEALEFLEKVKVFAPHLIGISMGKEGEVSRILGKVLGVPWTFASLSEESSTAPGQLSAESLLQIYHHETLSSHTSLYGLIGDPVTLSRSHLTHNEVFRSLSLNALYVKMQIRPEELAKALSLYRRLGWKGLSVTMPLKEAVLPYLDELDLEAQAIGAVNTVLFTSHKAIGYNTDGKGALDALEKKKKIQGLRLVILGAGGAGLAIAYEALQRGAKVFLLNRSLARVEKTMQAFPKNSSCLVNELSYLATIAEEGYDILINATSSPIPIETRFILPRTLAMECNSVPFKSSFLLEAEKKECTLVYGYEMFIHQAIGQFRIWLQEQFNQLTKEEVIEQMRAVFMRDLFRGELL